MININESSIIGQIVAEDHRTASIFSNYNIDYCCNGNIKLAEVCIEKQIDTDQLITELYSVLGMQSDTTQDFAKWPLDKLIQHIENKHHTYVEQSSKEISQLLDKICKVHGNEHPELFKVQNLFLKSIKELARHMKKEELLLFPNIRKISRAYRGESEYFQPPFGSIQNPIYQMESDHDNEGERFRNINALTNNLTPPKAACNTYVTTFKLLKEFEEDLHMHVHLENNILFPKSIKMESELINGR